MANQSIIAIPPDISDPVVLRRVLTRIVEQIDTLYGTRSGDSSAYVVVGDIQGSIDALQRDLKAAQDNQKVIVDDAPSDGKIYGRLNNEWVEIVTS